MSMSMTMMVPVRPMPALGREGGCHQRPGQHIPRKGGPSAQPQHGQGIKKQNLPQDEAMCPGSQGRQAGKGQKFAQLCTHACRLGQEICGEGPDSEVLDAGSPRHQCGAVTLLPAPHSSTSCLNFSFLAGGCCPPQNIQEPQTHYPPAGLPWPSPSSLA